MDGLRQRAAATLLKAAEDGTLEAVLSQRPTSQDGATGLASDWAPQKPIPETIR